MFWVGARVEAAASPLQRHDSPHMSPMHHAVSSAPSLLQHTFSSATPATLAPPGSSGCGSSGPGLQYLNPRQGFPSLLNGGKKPCLDITVNTVTVLGKV